jgi:radical SAM protein with 4Fe4S-binding SPASM domain
MEAPGGSAPMSVDPPFLVALNLTRRCNLECAHCYLDAGTRQDGAVDELKTTEIKQVLDEIADLSNETMIVLTGGEPMLRADIEELARHGADLGLMMVVGTNGVLLDDARVKRLMDAGVSGVGISLDSLDPDHHDKFRGRPGSWVKTMAGIDACRRGGLAFQLHFSVTNDNAAELEDMIAFARGAGALVLNVFFLVCTGRGESFTNVSSAIYDDVMRRVTQAAYQEEELIVRAKCAPHFKRMALELDADWPITLAHGYEAGGCLAGKRYCRVTPEGEMTACPYIEEPVGSVREEGFAGLWQDAPMFRDLRAPKLEGRCGACEYQKVCGGCRARPFARSGDLMGEDSLCVYEPAGGAVIEPARDEPGSVTWADEAAERLARVPPFLRKLIRRRAEQYVEKRGRQQVTTDDLEFLVRRRFGSAAPRPPFGGDSAGAVPGVVQMPAAADRND